MNFKALLKYIYVRRIFTMIRTKHYFISIKSNGCKADIYNPLYTVFQRVIILIEEGYENRVSTHKTRNSGRYISNT